MGALAVRASPLSALTALQARSHAPAPLSAHAPPRTGRPSALPCSAQAAAHRWYVLGLREVHKVVRTRRARCVVVAPNIEEVSCEGGLDAMLTAIADMCVGCGTERRAQRPRAARLAAWGWHAVCSNVAVCASAPAQPTVSHAHLPAPSGEQYGRLSFERCCGAGHDHAPKPVIANTVPLPPPLPPPLGTTAAPACVQV